MKKHLVLLAAAAFTLSGCNPFGGGGGGGDHGSGEEEELKTMVYELVDSYKISAELKFKSFYDPKFDPQGLKTFKNDIFYASESDGTTFFMASKDVKNLPSEFEETVDGQHYLYVVYEKEELSNSEFGNYFLNEVSKLRGFERKEPTITKEDGKIIAQYTNDDSAKDSTTIEFIKNKYASVKVGSSPVEFHYELNGPINSILGFDSDEMTFSETYESILQLRRDSSNYLSRKQSRTKNLIKRLETYDCVVKFSVDTPTYGYEAEVNNGNYIDEGDYGAYKYNPETKERIAYGSMKSENGFLYSSTILDKGSEDDVNIWRYNTAYALELKDALKNAVLEKDRSNDDYLFVTIDLPFINEINPDAESSEVKFSAYSFSDESTVYFNSEMNFSFKFAFLDYTCKSFEEKYEGATYIGSSLHELLDCYKEMYSFSKGWYYTYYQKGDSYEIGEERIDIHRNELGEVDYLYVIDYKGDTYKLPTTSRTYDDILELHADEFFKIANYELEGDKFYFTLNESIKYEAYHYTFNHAPCVLKKCYYGNLPSIIIEGTCVESGQTQEFTLYSGLEGNYEPINKEDVKNYTSAQTIIDALGDSSTVNLSYSIETERNGTSYVDYKNDGSTSEISYSGGYLRETVGGDSYFYYTSSRKPYKVPVHNLSKEPQLSEAEIAEYVATLEETYVESPHDVYFVDPNGTRVEMFAFYADEIRIMCGNDETMEINGKNFKSIFINTDEISFQDISDFIVPASIDEATKLFDGSSSYVLSKSDQSTQYYTDGVKISEYDYYTFEGEQIIHTYWDDTLHTWHREYVSDLPSSVVQNNKDSFEAAIEIMKEKEIPDYVSFNDGEIEYVKYTARIKYGEDEVNNYEILIYADGRIALDLDEDVPEWKWYKDVIASDFGTETISQRTINDIDSIRDRMLIEKEFKIDEDITLTLNPPNGPSITDSTDFEYAVKDNLAYYNYKMYENSQLINFSHLIARKNSSNYSYAIYDQYGIPQIIDSSFSKNYDSVQPEVLFSDSSLLDLCLNGVLFDRDIDDENLYFLKSGRSIICANVGEGDPAGDIIATDVKIKFSEGKNSVLITVKNAQCVIPGEITGIGDYVLATLNASYSINFNDVNITFPNN